MKQKHWQKAIDELLDGDLSADQARALREEAEKDAGLARAIIDAYQIQNELESLGMESVPESLHKRLRAIPRTHRRQSRPLLRWAGGLAATAAAVLVVVGVNQDLKNPSAAEISQAREELAVAFTYLNAIGQKAGLEIKQEIGGTMQEALITGIREGVSKEHETS